MKNTKLQNRLRRKKRIRGRVVGTSEHPRISVFKSNMHIYAQLVDDIKRKTIVSASDFETEKGKKPLPTQKAKKAVKQKESEDSTKKTDLTKTAKAGMVGEMLAAKAKAKKIKKVVFDRSGYRYHGVVKALAEGARKGGLEF
jgi:large subunit ribosomal protein L18